MDTQNPLKQIIAFQKKLFESTYETTCRLQGQAEEMHDTLLKKMPFLSEQAKKMIDDSVAMGKKARDSYKKAVDDGFVKLESLFNTK